MQRRPRRRVGKQQRFFRKSSSTLVRLAVRIAPCRIWLEVIPGQHAVGPGGLEVHRPLCAIGRVQPWSG